MDERTMWEDLGKINPSIESEVIEAGNISDVEIRCPRPNVSDNYNKLTNKPKINDVTLSGNVSLDTLGITDLIDTKINTAIGNALKGSY